MQAQKHKTRKLNLHAKGSKFDFKFRATKIESTRKLPKLSIFLRLHKCIFQVKLDPRTSVPGWRRRPRTLKSKFLNFLQKLKTLPRKKQKIAAEGTQNIQNPDGKLLLDEKGKVASQKPVFTGSLLAGTLALLSESICEKDQTGTIIHGSFMLLFLALVFKKYMTGNARTLLVFLTIATAVCAVAFNLDKYMNHDQGLVTELAWKAWNYAASSGCLYELSQAIFSRFAHLRAWWCSQKPVSMI